MSRPLDYFKYRQGKLFAENVSLQEISEAVGTPVYVYSKQGFLEPFEKLKKGLRSLDHLICYALKANSNLALLKILGDAGSGMDLVSAGELFRARQAGIPAERIVFSGVGKTTEEIALALEAGIYSFNVESVPELEILNEIALRAQVRAPVALRFNPDVDAKTHPYISTGLKKNKFGMNKKEISALIPELSLYEGIQLKGLSIHIGSQLLSLNPLQDAYSRLWDLVEWSQTRLNEPLEFVDLGGGLGIQYHNEKHPTVSEYCRLIQKNFSPKVCRSKIGTDLKVLIEPGRTIVGNAGVLLTEILYRKKRDKKDFLIVDSGMNDLLRPSLYGSYHEIVPLEHKSKGKSSLKSSDIVGPVCESSDCFATDRRLPSSLNSGDRLAILSAGAYGFSMSSNYNTRPKAAEVLVDGSEFRIIRKRESYSDLIRGESF